MPLAPPVTTTTLPATCIATSPRWPSGQDQGEHRGVMAGPPEQDETMQDHVLEAQPPPGMKDDPETIERAAGQHAPQRQLRQCRNDAVVEHQPAPAEREIEPDRETVEPAGPAQFQHDAGNGDA